MSHLSRELRLALAAMLLGALSPALAQQIGSISKLGIDMEVRSGARILADEMLAGPVILPDGAPPVSAGEVAPQIQLRGTNRQISDSSSNYAQIFAGFRPFVHATKSEVSTAAFGQNIVMTYNDSTGIHLGPNPQGPGLIVDSVLISAFSVSNDGGQTWKSGRMPPAVNGSQTFGDPSVGADRHGVFYFAHLAESVTTSNGKPVDHGAIAVSKSVDGGNTWSPGAIVQIDDDSDKEWLAVGPDPTHKNRDNVYVTWTSFQTAACELRLGRSTDGGATWTAKTILVPTGNSDPTKPQNCLQSSNPTVDSITGSLYVPFLRFSNANQDFIQMLASDDAGETFHFVEFHVPGAPDTTVVPTTQAGELTACGGSNIRLTIHGTADAGPGAFGIHRYVNASRNLSQPAMAARNGILYLAWSNSTSLSFGTGADSNVLFIRSDDGGAHWTIPITVNPVVAGDTQHVFPSLAIDTDPTDVHVSYYTQHSDRTIDLDMANSHDRGATFPTDRVVRVSDTSFNLPPSNIRLSNSPAFSATNFDRMLDPCYALGEYQGITAANGAVYVGWGDTRNLITEPVNTLDPISGQTHSQAEVFFQKVKAQ